jgi:hypothetical protein
MTLSGVDLCEPGGVFAAMARADLCDKQKPQGLKTWQDEYIGGKLQSKRR